MRTLSRFLIWPAAWLFALLLTFATSNALAQDIIIHVEGALWPGLTSPVHPLAIQQSSSNGCATCATRASAIRRAADPIWTASIVSLGASHTLDLHSTWGNWANMERNPWFRGPDGRFSPRRAVPIKAGIIGVSYFAQRWIVKRSRPLRIAFTVANFGGAALMARVAARNYQVRRLHQ